MTKHPNIFQKFLKKLNPNLKNYNLKCVAIEKKKRNFQFGANFVKVCVKFKYNNFAFKMLIMQYIILLQLPL